MILIADSGSTKTDWCVAENGNVIQRMTTKGMNPYFQSEEEISAEIETALLPQLEPRQFNGIYFYGAGCTVEKAEIVKNAILKHLKTNDIDVGSDIIAAARALCGHAPGITCILGTGSNSCFYDGKNVTENVSPLGFILGDEGSGAVLGKLFVSDLLKNQLTAGLKEKFLAQYQLTPADIIDRVYRKPFPNRFLATFAPFILENIQDPGIHALVLNSFKAFLKRNVMQYDYPNKPIGFVGSVAFHFKDVLIKAVSEMGLTMGKVIKSPMEELVKYYA